MGIYSLAHAVYMEDKSGHANSAHSKVHLAREELSCIF